MNNTTTNNVLTLVLAVVVLLGVVFVLQTVFRERELRTLQGQVFLHQRNMQQVAGLFGEAAQYGKTHPDIDPILQPFIKKPAAR